MNYIYSSNDPYEIPYEISSKDIWEKMQDEECTEEEAVERLIEEMNE